MSGSIALGACVSPEQASVVAPFYDYLEVSVMGALDPLVDDEAFAPRLEMLQRLPLPVRACNSFVNPQVKLVGPEVHWETITLYVERAFRRAQALGVERIVFGSGGARNVPEGFPRERAWHQLIQFCRLCSDIAYPGLVLVIEPLNRGETNIVNSYAEAVALAQDVDRPNVRALADIYHFQVEGEPLDTIRQGTAWLAHVHLADSERRYPGSGTYPLKELFALLHEIGYSQAASVECRWGENLAYEARAAAEFLRPLIG